MQDAQTRALQAMWLVFVCALVLYPIIGLAVPPFMQFEESLLRILAITLVVIALLARAASHLLWRRASAGGLRAQQRYVFLLLTWSFDELIGMFGLILALSGLDSASWILFPGAAMVLLILHRPHEIQQPATSD